MAQIQVIGWITNDLEVKHSESGTPYLRFGLAERIGYGNQMRMQYYQVWAWKETAEALIRSGLKKGSLVRLSGQLLLEEYVRQDGITKDKRLRISLSSGGFTPVSREGRNPSPSQTTVETVDGGRETLPE